MARNCPSCGRANDDDARFCAGCGAELGPAAARRRGGPAGATHGPAGVAGAANHPQGTSPAAIVLIVVLVVVAAIAAASIWWTVVRGPATARRADAGRLGRPRVGQSDAGGSGYLAAVVGRQGNVLGTVAADGRIRELATTSAPGLPHRLVTGRPAHRRRRRHYKLQQLAVVDLQDGNAVTRCQSRRRPSSASIPSAWLDPDELLVSAFTTRPRTGARTATARLRPVRRPGAALDRLERRPAPRRRGERGPRRSRVAFVTYTDQKVDQYGIATALEHLEILDCFSGTSPSWGRTRPTSTSTRGASTRR